MTLLFNISFGYSPWLIFFCIIAGAVYAGLLYFRDKKLVEVNKNIIRSMAVLRFITVSFLAFLLLSPLIVMLENTIEKPIIIVARDNSESILINKDSTYYKGEYVDQTKDFIESLKNDFEVIELAFGDVVSEDKGFTFDQKTTNFSELTREIFTRFSGRNIGAVILSTDGIYNKGSNPYYESGDFDFPVYTVALGDTSLQRDLFISELNTNKIAFLGNNFPVQVFVKANKLKGQTTKISLFHNSETVFSEVIKIESEEFEKTINLQTEAKPAGLQRYRISLMTLDGEISKENNHRDFVVEVIENRQKILVLSNSPHPDVAALKKAFEKNENFEVIHQNINDFTGKITDYNLVVLHQLPSVKNPATTVLADLLKNNISVLFVLGSQSNIKQINALNTGFSISQRVNSIDESQGIFNKEFLRFEVNEDFVEMVRFLPPLSSPYGEYAINGDAGVVFWQKIKNVTTSRPLIFFTDYNSTKIGCICGEGIWKWRIQDFVQNNSHNLFDEFFNKISQYLSLKLKKQQFTVSAKNVYPENESVLFSAELYNESYELVNEADVTLEITDQNNKKYPFTFSKTDNAYRLNAGMFPPGDYTWVAKVTNYKKAYSTGGKFTVVPVQMEAQNTRADHGLLFRIAEKTGGKMFFPSQYDQLLDHIRSNKDIVPVSYSDKNYKDLINLKWIFFALLVLISAEWFFRKYFGSY